MRRGWMALVTCAALVLSLHAIVPIALPHADQAYAAGKKDTAGKAASRAKAKTRQWTGTVVTLDKESITVVKGKKKPQKKTFSRSADTRIQGDLEEGVRVTVYYRENGRKAEAHRIVVKE